jgi:hypothetical protein
MILGFQPEHYAGGMNKNERVGGGRSPQEEAETSSCFGVGIAKAVTSALYQ